MSPSSPIPSSPSLDGLEFRMVSSTASEVDPDAPTVFRYRQDGALVWGEYTGDTVSTGRFVGETVDGGIEIRFGHVLLDGGAVITGSAASRIERDDDGLIRLVEDFEKHGVAHRSVCVQVV